MVRRPYVIEVNKPGKMIALDLKKNRRQRTWYPAKVLLFGEYTLLLGKAGLAVPLSDCGGSLTGAPATDARANESNRSIYGFFNFLVAQKTTYRFLELDRFAGDLKDGLWFDSNIPVGSGLGSSGAVVAAIYDRYKTGSSNTLNTLKGQLATLENYFHRKSSGIDPLVSYLNLPLLIKDANNLTSLSDWQSNNPQQTVFLVDTTVRSKTGNLVEEFLVRWNSDSAFRYVVDNQYVPLTDRLAGKFTNADNNSVWEDLQQLSELQRFIFDPMIPDSFKQHFSNGLSTDSFLLKLCGSGGGGFMLGFTKERAFVDDYFAFYRLPVLFI